MVFQISTNENTNNPPAIISLNDPSFCAASRKLSLARSFFFAWGRRGQLSLGAISLHGEGLSFNFLIVVRRKSKWFVEITFQHAGRTVQMDGRNLPTRRAQPRRCAGRTRRLVLRNAAAARSLYPWYCRFPGSRARRGPGFRRWPGCGPLDLEAMPLYPRVPPVPRVA